MDALKTLMINMTNTLLQQVTNQVKRTMKGVSSLRQPPTLGGEVHSKNLVPHEDARLHIGKQLTHEQPRGVSGVGARQIIRAPQALCKAHEVDSVNNSLNFVCHTLSMVDMVRRTRVHIPPRKEYPKQGRGSPKCNGKYIRDARSILMEIKGHPMLKKPLSMASRPKPRNTKCRALKKALRELTDKGEIDHFLRHGGNAKAHESTLNECPPKTVATIARGYAEGISYAMWKARMRGTQQVINIKQGAPVTTPIITFSESKGRPVMAPFDDPVVIELKVASALVCRILIDTKNSVDIISWECLQKLKYPGRDITPLMFNPIRIVRLPLQFRDKVKSKSLKVDFLVANPPQSKGRDSTLPATDPLVGDQHMTDECYLVSIKPFVGHERSEEPAVPKKPHVEEPALVEASLICAMEIEDLK
ncbi:hypothetical protein Cgig2_016076 [Carnegiea gigantea]|uniref:Uncharacterized protein n=1 Tax=Carnegiea gigantea TaxID=171969 RepID=A0A9Q1GN21_9CARY|nr:hypothetical protein Cgig2_016076 [Carnegiea gigantea]